MNDKQAYLKKDVLERITESDQKTNKKTKYNFTNILTYLVLTIWSLFLIYCIIFTIKSKFF